MAQTSQSYALKTLLLYLDQCPFKYIIKGMGIGTGPKLHINIDIECPMEDDAKHETKDLFDREVH